MCCQRRLHLSMSAHVELVHHATEQGMWERHDRRPEASLTLLGRADHRRADYALAAATNGYNGLTEGDEHQ